MIQFAQAQYLLLLFLIPFFFVIYAMVMKMRRRRIRKFADEAMAFGDGGNDISMLRLAHIGVATGNAGDHVKAAADYVCPPVEREGVLDAFRHFGLIE